MLDDANLFDDAKLKYFIGDTASFAARTSNDLRALLFVNLLLLVALVIVVSEVSPGTDQTTAREVAGAAANPSPSLHIATSQSSFRHLLSYVAVALQLAWFGRLLFHYRQKNSELVTSNITTSSAPGSSSDRSDSNIPEHPVGPT